LPLWNPEHIVDINKRILDAAIRHIPLNPADLKNLEGIDARGLAAMGVVAEATLLDAWYKALLKKAKPTRIEAFISLLVDRDEVADNIDARLERGDFRVLNDLVRLGLPWEHPRIADALKDPEACHAAAISLVEQDSPEAVMAFLEQTDDVDIFRALSLLGGPFAEPLMHLRDDTGEESEERAVLDASLIGMIEAEGYGRLLLNGELDSAWTAYPQLMGDVFTLCGPNSWVETLALLEAAGDLDAFSFGGIIGAAVSSLTLGLDEEDELEEPKNFEQFQTDSRFSVAAGLAPDEEILELLFNAVVHECRLTHDQPSLGIPGLPLSSSNPSEQDVEELVSLFEEFMEDGTDDPVKRVAVVRNLMDAALWAVDEPGFVTGLVEPAQALLAKKMPLGVRAAAFQFLQTVDAAPEVPADFNPSLKALVGNGDISALGQVARGDGIAALSALQHLLDLASVEAIEEMLNVWMDAPVLRSDVIRRLLLDALVNQLELESEFTPFSPEL